MYKALVIEFLAVSMASQICDPDKCPPQQKGVNFNGYDLRVACGTYNRSYVFGGSIHYGFQDCCAICQGDPECGSFTLDTESGICHLKTKDGPRGAIGGNHYISGTMADATGFNQDVIMGTHGTGQVGLATASVALQTCNVDKCPPQHKGVSFNGYDLRVACGYYLRSYTNGGSTPYHFYDCCVICEGDPECGSFTVDTSGVCYLKGKDGPHGATGDDQCISGTKAEAPGFNQDVIRSDAYQIQV